MADEQNSRRKFLQILGLGAGAGLMGTSAFAAFTNETEIRQLTPEQQDFMKRYGSWMDDFIEVIRIQNSEPSNMDNQRKMIALTEKAEKFQPELDAFMKDETFSMVYHSSIERMSREIRA